MQVYRQKYLDAFGKIFPTTAMPIFFCSFFQNRPYPLDFCCHLWYTTHNENAVQGERSLFDSGKIHRYGGSCCDQYCNDLFPLRYSRWRTDPVLGGSRALWTTLRHRGVSHCIAHVYGGELSRMVRQPVRRLSVHWWCRHGPRAIWRIQCKRLVSRHQHGTGYTGMPFGSDVGRKWKTNAGHLSGHPIHERCHRWFALAGHP